MRALALSITLILAACQNTTGSPTDQPTGIFTGVSPAETIYLTGTEPFWAGEIAGAQAVYTTPENQDGIRFDVARFAGNNGLAFTGELDGRTFDLTITPGACSDGMSDRSYPYTATLRIADDARFGCAWTDRQPFTGPRNP